MDDHRSQEPQLRLGALALGDVAGNPLHAGRHAAAELQPGADLEVDAAVVLGNDRC